MCMFKLTIRFFLRPSSAVKIFSLSACEQDVLNDDYILNLDGIRIKNHSDFFLLY